MAGGTTRGRSCALRYMTARQNPPPTRLKHASIYYPQWKSPTIMLLFVSAEKKPPTQQDQRQPWPALARSRQTPPQYRDLVVVLMPCRAADRKVVSQSLGSYSRRPCSRPLEGRREHPSACPRVLPPIASHRSGTTSSNPRFHGAYCRPATLSARNNVSNETASKNQGAKTPRPEQTQYTLTSPPPKTPQKGGDNPIHTRSTNPHPETPMHNSPPQPPSYNLNPSARDTSEEYRPPIHKTTIYLPTQTPPVSLPCTTSTVRRKKSGNIPPPPHFFLP